MGQGGIYLVACVNKKHLVPMKARDLYTSPLFAKSVEFAESQADQWFILSAKHGLLDPDRVIEPYDHSLRSMGAAERRIWAQGVARSLLPRLNRSDRVVMFAGKLYRENLVSPIREHGCNLEIPMEGLRIGEQLKWLNEQLQD